METNDRGARSPQVMSAQERVEKETAAFLKRMLGMLEDVASKEPQAALDPIEFNGNRKQVMRAVWTLVKQAMAAGAEVETTIECPHCGGPVKYVTRGL